MKAVIAIVAGLFTAILLELIAVKLMAIYLVPGEYDINDQASMRLYIQNASSKIFLLFMLLHAFTAFSGSWLASRISGSARPGLTVTLIFLTVCMINYLSYPYPSWAVFGGAVFILLGGYAGTRRNNLKS